MTRQSIPMNAACRVLLNYLATACLGIGLLGAGGCNSSQAPPEVKPAGAEEQSKEQSPAAGEAAPAAEQTPVTAESVLRRMVAAYKKASSYADAGTVRLAAQLTDEAPIDQPANYALTLVRPNKIRLEIYQAMLVCDGQQLRAAIQDLPNQVLLREAPAELTVGSILSDRVLASVLMQGFAGLTPQLILLLADDPMAMLSQDAEETTLAEPGTIDGRKYHRVKITQPEGTAVYWIDQQTHVLRRLVLPTGALRNALARGATVENVSLVADFPGAQLDGKIDAKAFQFETPPGADVVEFFVPPHPAQLLGKQVPEFRFVDLQGNPVTPALLAGKIAVLDFWATWCGPCRASLPELGKVYGQYKDRDKLAFFAVSVDRPEATNQKLRDTFDELGVQVPILRDLQQDAGSVFHTTGIPTMFILDADGVVQDYEVGGNPELATVLPEKIEKLLAGEDIYQEPLEKYRKQLEQYQREQERAAEDGSPEAAIAEQRRVPRAEIARRGEPKTFKLSPLWKCAELQAPGNILVVPSADGRPWLLVVEAFKSVAEVGLDGRVIATHPLDIEEVEFINTLRTAVGADGTRYFVALAWAGAEQRCHLFDESWNLVVSYPEEALNTKHSGIADVELGDLDADGTPEMYVGYFGVVGVQAVSLNGNRLWSNRSVSSVSRMAIGAPDAQGRRNLFCTNTTGSLAVFNSEGERQGQVTVAGRPLGWITAADLDSDGRPEWCGLAGAEMGDNVAVGLDLTGKELWNYTLPHGVYQQPIARVVPGRLLPTAASQWLLPGPDGSIHVIAADGKLLDRFNYGASLNGLATAELNGRPMLIVSSPQGLEAWGVE